MKWHTYLICFALIVAGIFSSIELTNMFNVVSQDIGTPIVINQKTEELCKYDLSDIIFEKENDNSYITTKSYKAIDYDGTVNNYKLLLNGKSLPDVTYSPGSINATIIINYYGSENEQVTSTRLSVNMQFNKSQTLVKLHCYNNTESNISYLQKFININGFVLQIIKEV